MVDWEWVAVLQSFKVSSFILAPYPSLVDWDWVGVSLTTIAEKHISFLEIFLFIGNVGDIVLFSWETFWEENQAGRGWEQEAQDLLWKEGKCLSSSSQSIEQSINLTKIFKRKLNVVAMLCYS